MNGCFMVHMHQRDQKYEERDETGRSVMPLRRRLLPLRQVMDQFGTDHVVARTLDFSLESMVDEDDASKKMDKKLKSQVGENSIEYGSLSEDLGSQLSSYLGEFGKENEALDANTVTRTTKVAGLHELVMLAEEFESEEVTERKEEEVAEMKIVQGNANNEESYHEQEQQSDAVEKGQGQSKLTFEEKKQTVAKGNHVVSSHHSIGSKSERPNAGVLGKGLSQLLKSRLPQNPSTSIKGGIKVITRSSVDVSSKGNKGEKSQFEGMEVTLPSSNSSLHPSIKLGTARSKYTVPQPFALATDKRAATGVRPADEVASNAARRTNASSVPSSSVAKRPQLSAKPATLALPMSNPLRSESLKLLDQNANPLKQVELKLDEEDVNSVSSSTATLTSDSKAKLSNVAAAPVFTFRCNERAEKRKEFFSKLEEKLNAKEAEKNQLQAKSKEQQEAEIKMLRKSLTFKASPMPTFYHEAPPPKVELKKIPPTRAKSPKLGRRNSCAGLEAESKPNQICRMTRLSFDQNKINGCQQNLTGENASKTFGKDIAAAKRTVRRSLVRMPSEKTPMTKFNERPSSPIQGRSNSSEGGCADGSTEDVKLTTSNLSSNSSGSASYRLNDTVQNSEAGQKQTEAAPLHGQNEIAETNVETNLPRELGSLIDDCEGGNTGSHFGTGSLVEGFQVSDGSTSKSSRSKSFSHSVVQRIEKIPSNNMDAYGTNTKFVRSSQQGLAGETKETSGKGVTNPRRERLKAMTPYFKNSKRESGGSTSLKNTGKGKNNMAHTVPDVSVQS